MAAASKKAQIVASALELFYRDGFNATGVERICKAAGVSKKTLYNHFNSKDDLVLATLKLRDSMFRNRILRETEKLGSTPRDRLLTIFDAHDAWFNEKDFSGCMFINAAAEFSCPDNPNHILSAGHKQLMREYLGGLALAAGARQPQTLASQLNLLLEGAIVDAYVSGNKNAAMFAKTMADTFVAQAFA